MRLTTTADRHDLFAAERFLAAEARIAATFGRRVEEAVAPLLRAMRATGRTTYATDPERGAIWGHAFLRPPYAPDAAAEWFLVWGLRFPDGGTGWDGADPPLPRGVHAVVALGAGGDPQRRPGSLPRASSPWLVGAGRRGRLPRGGASLARASRRARRHGRGAVRVDPGPAGRPQDGAARPRGRMRRRKEARRALHHHGWWAWPVGTE